MSNVTDMSKTRLKVDAGTSVAHYASGSNNAATATLKIGSLESTAADAALSGSGSSYQIGYLNTDTRFAGVFTAARITKVGTGRLTLSATGHTSPITVSDGVLELNNATSTTMTTGLITVTGHGVLTGNGLVSSVTVNEGGTVTGGINNNVGTLRLKGSMTLNKGAILRCALSATSNTKFTVQGNVKHTGDTILVVIPASRRLSVGDELEIFNVAGMHTGEFVVKVESEGMGYEFDDSLLLSDGKLRVKAVADGIDAVVATDAVVDVYNLHGVRLYTQQPYGKVFRQLPRGTYIVTQGNRSQKIVK
jgi:hypothetical protein